MNKIIVTLEDSDYILCKSAKEKIMDILPKGKNTIPSFIADYLGVSRRAALISLDALEKEGKLSSKMGTIKSKNTTSRCRIFKKI